MRACSIVQLYSCTLRFAQRVLARRAAQGLWLCCLAAGSLSGWSLYRSHAQVASHHSSGPGRLRDQRSRVRAGAEAVHRGGAEERSRRRRWTSCSSSRSCAARRHLHSSSEAHAGARAASGRAASSVSQPAGRGSTEHPQARAAPLREAAARTHQQRAEGMQKMGRLVGAVHEVKPLIAGLNIVE